MQIWVGTRKGLFHFTLDEKGPVLAHTAFLGDPANLVQVDSRNGTVFACLSLGHFGSKIQRSNDNGETWKELPMPVFPEKPAEAEDLDPIRKDPLDWSVKQIWSLEAGGEDQPGRLWCGTIPGGLFTSNDCGNSWSLVTSLWNDPARRKWFGGGADFPGIHSICVHPEDSARVLVGVSCGGVWQTEDHGATWRNTAAGMRANYMPPEQEEDPDIQDPHRIARCRDAPDRLWCQHHNALYRSDDGGESWVDLGTPAPSNFGFAVAAHPKDADTAWFVPAVDDGCRVPVDGRVVVNRTGDGGNTFASLDQGLPLPPAYDLVYRHALDVGPDGRVLAMGSTTGGLWVSQDGGEHWELVSAHLPPVYAVRVVGDPS